jgi:hypothetical protein
MWEIQKSVDLKVCAHHFRFATNIDGNGGEDTIHIAGEVSPIKQAHLGNEITGQHGIVLLPFALDEISMIQFHNEQFIVSSKEWSGIEASNAHCSLYNPYFKVRLG